MTDQLLKPKTIDSLSILFVDDEQRVLDGYRRVLRPFTKNWTTHFLTDSRDAAPRIRRDHIDVVVTDLRMPFVTGIDLVKDLQSSADTKHIPTIVVTGQDDRSLKRKSLDAGAADLLAKPVQTEELLARIRNAQRLKMYYDELSFKNVELESQIRERTCQLQHSRQEIIARLSMAGEYRDCETGRHVVRVAHYSRLIALQMGLPAAEVELIFAAAPLHDIGKIAIPDAILLKTGRLTDDERRIMKEHCKVGASILSECMEENSNGYYGLDFQRNSVSSTQFDPILRCARQIALTHHEHWNGGGYPDGLVGEQIPLAGRIVALADVFDALTTSRPYKAALSLAEALRTISEDVGRQFDPSVYASFVAAIPQIEVLRLQLMDDSAGTSKFGHIRVPTDMKLTDPSQSLRQGTCEFHGDSVQKVGRNPSGLIP